MKQLSHRSLSRRYSAFIALGDQPTHASIERALKEGLKSPFSKIASAAAYAARGYPTQEIVTLLEARLADTDVSVVTNVSFALAHMAADSNMKQLLLHPTPLARVNGVLAANKEGSHSDFLETLNKNETHPWVLESLDQMSGPGLKQKIGWRILKLNDIFPPAHQKRSWVNPYALLFERSGAIAIYPLESGYFFFNSMPGPNVKVVEISNL